MRQFYYIIKDESGMHARPAGMLIKEAEKFEANIVVKKNNKIADAKRLFSVMGLAAKRGEEIQVTAEGSDEEAAIIAMEAFFKENL